MSKPAAGKYGYQPILPPTKVGLHKHTRCGICYGTKFGGSRFCNRCKHEVESHQWCTVRELEEKVREQEMRLAWMRAALEGV